MKLSQKILILICLPLILQTMFISSLVFALIQMEKEMEKIENSRAVSMYFNIQLEGLLEAIAAEVLFYVLKEQHYMRQFQNTMNVIKRQSENIEKRLKPGISDDVAAMKKISEEVFTNMMEVDRFARSDDRVDMMRGFLKVKRLMSKVNKIGAGFVERQSQLAEEQSKQQAAMRFSIVVMIIVGVFLTILSTAVLVVFFFKGVRKQLIAIEGNLHRLSHQKVLQKPLAGEDELSQIDQTIYKLSVELEEAKQRKQEVYSMITHDLRSPLTSLKIVFDLLKMGHLGSLNEKGSERIKSADYLVGRMVNLTNDLLDVEKFESGVFDLRLERVALSKLFEDCAVSIKAKLETKKIELVVFPSDLIVLCDPDRILRVLTNLADNAVKFSSQESKIELAGSQTESLIEISVKDYGKGIPETHLEKIFERFSQVSRDDEAKQGGSGLGLAICKAIVEAHGGSIRVESKAGEGSRFIFTLPKPSGALDD
ncbi:MAG: HAMP domain-containing histidine kinase [Candidatus Melainabacteria bacterium]|jgi:signal transduction histidine kinase|nr:HAMP domain-containing histidine kinase [Candidatus Melainabacteria bacterium]